MVTQPAYIANLKAYARARFSDPTDEDKLVDDIVSDLSNESDRGAIILAATSIEDTLERAILPKFPTLLRDETARKRIFEGDGIISTFSEKIEIAYAFGIIDEETKKQIDLIREIRNCCAHSRKPLSMDKDVLLNACKAVISDTLHALRKQDQRSVRLGFTVKCSFLCLTIITGEKFNGVEAQLKYYAKLQAEEERFSKESGPRGS